ncbi:hypothetical protein B0O99DRAFT_570830 [Bisporella sp. PMI_857]|nr:hypothetical protein B0O99DRAFT_570830 [Bisporella sp. PMI_857]
MAFWTISWIRVISVICLLSLVLDVQAVPQRRRKGSKAANGETANGGATGNGQGTTAQRITTATDGSMILDKTVTIDGLPIRYKISAPADQFTADSGVPGGTATAGTAGTAGLNVLLHGDGGQSFVDFPNQAVQNNLMGVVVLAPNQERFWGGGSGLQRTDGVQHAAAVNTLITQQLAQDVAFDPANVFFTGVSGGSLLLSGFFVPAFGATYQTGVVLNCGALAPQVDVVDANTLVSNMKIHFQTTKDELASLQDAIPAAITAYEDLATTAGLSADQIGQLQTVDNTPDGGGHCGFDGQGFVSGVQLMSDGYADIMGDNATGAVNGINVASVLTSVVGNENVVFTSAGRAQKRDGIEYI